MRFSIVLLFAILITLLLAPLGGAWAQELPAVQEIHGSLAPGQSDVFRITGLVKGQTLYGFMENTFGNLDPILSVCQQMKIFSATLKSFQARWQSWPPARPSRCLTCQR